MKETDKITTSYLTNITGDPFADTGGLVIKHLWTLPHLKDRDIMGLVDFAANLYVNKWGGKLHAFFLNSKITQAAFAGQRKIDEAMKYYKALIDETESFKEGYCRISGRKTKLFAAGRDNHILSGSGTFINFHHNFESGLFLSKEILIRIFFVPLGVLLIGKNLSLIQSNRIDIQDYFVKKILFGVDGHFSAATISLSKGEVLKYPYANPAVALFSFADECIANLEIATYNEITDEIENEGVILNLYYFSNYGTEPNIELYTIPASLFKFYSICLKNILYKSDWDLFIKHNYIKYKGYHSNYDSIIGTYNEKASEVIQINNGIYDLLFKNTNLNFNIAKVGQGNDFVQFNKGDYDNWKQKSKNFSDWQKESNVKALLKEKPVKSIKGEFVLKYKAEDFQKKWINIIYEKLLKQESILIHILIYLRKWYKTNSFNFKIVRSYTINILKMKSSTLNLIEKIADEILKDESNLKKNINQNLSTQRYDTVRSFIIKLIRQNHKAGEEKPIITLEEYAKDLFYEGGNWKEVRDLLLICIFQKMHENKIFFDAEDEEEDIEETENENVNV